MLKSKNRRLLWTFLVAGFLLYAFLPAMPGLGVEADHSTTDLVAGQLADAADSHSDVDADVHGADHGEGGHGHDKVRTILLVLIIFIAVAKVIGHVFEILHMPVVLGELIGGVILGNLGLFGFHGLEFLKNEEIISVLAEIGVIFLLFEVGLHSSLGELMKVGLSSLLVAIAGVIAPFFLGLGVSMYFLPDAHFLVHTFIGATLCATSVGITARVLKDIGKIDTTEARIILGAAVIDDVLGLIILAIVQGAIMATNSGDVISATQIGLIVFKATMFFVGSFAVGMFISPHMFRLASKLRVEGMLLATAILFCFTLSWLAAVVGLAPIVGAFCAGLILEEVHYKSMRHKTEATIEERIEPISYFLVPIFFVLMGMKVDLTTFAQLEILGFAAALSVVAILGKQVCSLGVLAKDTDKFAVGLAMIPRGEVGLIFANIGLGLTLQGQDVIDNSTYSAVVIMVIVTTLITPPLLKWKLTR